MSAGVRLRQLSHEAAAAAGPDGFAMFKWTCLGCGERCMFNQPNAIWTSAEHETRQDGSRCGHVTDLNDPRADVGYLVVLRVESVADTVRTVHDSLQRRDASRSRN